MIATGELDRLRDVVPQESDTADSEEAPDEPDRAVTEIEQLVSQHDYLLELHEMFLKAFANPPRQPEVEFEPTVKSVLFLMNEQRVLALLEPSPGNLIDRLSKIEDNRQAVEQLFLSIFIRRPTEEDAARLATYLTDNQHRRVQSLGHLAWAMLASTEFFVNH